MKKAVGHLIPFMEEEREKNKTHAGTMEEEASHFVLGFWALWVTGLKDLLGGVGTMRLGNLVMEDKIEQRSLLSSIQISWDFSIKL